MELKTTLDYLSKSINSTLSHIHYRIGNRLFNKLLIKSLIGIASIKTKEMF